VTASPAHVRRCATCENVGPRRCIYVVCRDPLAVGLCMRDEIAQPVPCRTCEHRNVNTGTAGTYSQLCTACLQADFAAWKRGTDCCSRPPYQPQKEP